MFRMPPSLADLLAFHFTSVIPSLDLPLVDLRPHRSLGPGRRDSTRIHTGRRYPHSSTRQQARYARLLVGTPVNKVLGYPFPGTVVAAFHTLAGQERFVVEATGADYRGMLHIFNGDQLRVAKQQQGGAA